MSNGGIILSRLIREILEVISMCLGQGKSYLIVEIDIPDELVIVDIN